MLRAEAPVAWTSLHSFVISHGLHPIKHVYHLGCLCFLEPSTAWLLEGLVWAGFPRHKLAIAYLPCLEVDVMGTHILVLTPHGWLQGSCDVSREGREFRPRLGPFGESEKKRPADRSCSEKSFSCYLCTWLRCSFFLSCHTIEIMTLVLDPVLH